MPECAPRPEFAGLSPRPLKAPLAGTETTATAETEASLWTQDDVREQVLARIWPSLLALRTHILEKDGRTDEGKMRIQKQGTNSWVLREVSTSPDSTWLEWLPPEALGLAASRVAWEGVLSCRGTDSEWSRAALVQWGREATQWWVAPPPNLPDLTQMWLAGLTDMTGDQVLMVQGNQDQLLAASQKLAKATYGGRPLNLILNGSTQQNLEPWQAALLLPGAIQEGALVVLR